MSHGAMIVKADGTREPFNEDKLRASLMRAGASVTALDRITAHVRGEIEDGMTTHHIYKHAFSLLSQLEHPVASRYSLKRAIEELGPSGFPFESYIAELFRARGFEAALRQTLSGRCVPHEVDVVAWNESKLLMIESKFHNQPGIKTDIKVALYVKARFDDLSEQLFEFGKKRPLDEGWLVTNTKFTNQAVQYASCAHVQLLGWNYPEKQNLERLISDYGLHPITCLSTLSGRDRAELLLNDVVLCRDVIREPQRIREAGLHGDRYKMVLEEAKKVCGS